jgi:hypothetical protein
MTADASPACPIAYGSIGWNCRVSPGGRLLVENEPEIIVELAPEGQEEDGAEFCFIHGALKPGRWPCAEEGKGKQKKFEEAAGDIQPSPVRLKRPSGQHRRGFAPP